MAPVTPLLAFLFSTPLSALAVAAGAASVPIIIHLLNRKRYHVVVWAAMKFLLAAQRKNIRRLRLEQWLLLAVRTLLVLLLVAAMASVMGWAEPLWQRLFPGAPVPAAGGGRTHRILVIDGCFTMATKRSDAETRFDAAKAQARAVLERSAPGDGFSVVFLSSPAQTIVPGPADDREKVAKEVADLRLPHGSTDLAGGLHAVAEMVSKPLGKYAQREVYFLTDLKRSSWPLPVSGAPAPSSPPATGPAGGLAEAWQQVAHSKARVVFVDVGREEVENCAVTGLSLGDPLPLVGVNTSASAVVSNFGKQDRKRLKVELLIGRLGSEGTGSGTDRVAPREVEAKFIDIPAGGSVTVTFALEKQNRFRNPGDHLLQVRIDPDAMPLDDVRSLAVNVRDAVPVAVVNGKSASEPLYRAGTMLALALNPYPENEPNPAYPARVDSIGFKRFTDAAQGDFSRDDCVFLCDLPKISSHQIDRLEAHLKRGGSVVIGLGPNAAGNLGDYNRLLAALQQSEDRGPGGEVSPPPVRLIGVRRAEGRAFFSFTADEESFARPPLAAFQDDDARAGLALPRFREYVRVAAPPRGPARRILSFFEVRPGGPGEEVKAPGSPDPASTLDPAVIEWPRHRGKVILYASSFNTDWTNWPLSPSFAPFVNELLRFAVAGGQRQTVLAGEPIDEYLPPSLVGLSASLSRITADGEEDVESVPVVSRDDAGFVRFAATDQSGVYRASVGAGRKASLFAVNVPVTAPGGGAESDLQPLEPSVVQSSAPEADLEIVRSVADVAPRRAQASSDPEDAELALAAQPRGPGVARVLLLVVLALILLEVLLAWAYGSARAAGPGSSVEAPAPRRWGWFAALWAVPLACCAVLLGVVLHAAVTGQPFGFLPDSWKGGIEHALGVPEAAPGEGTRWRLEFLSYPTGDAASDRWLEIALGLAALALVVGIYRRERGTRRTLLPLGGLRVGLLLLTLAFLLPQVRLLFEREGWPDIAVVFDDSQSMAVVDTFADPVIAAKAETLKREWAKLAAPRIEKARQRVEQLKAQLARDPSAAEAKKLSGELAREETRLRDLQTPHRLNLIKALLASSGKDWLRTFLEKRQMRVHVFRASGQAVRVAELSDPEQCARVLDEIMEIVPSGDSSQLGSALKTVLKTFRGGSLNAVVMFTDGVTTKGDDLTQAGRLAARMGVPLYFVGVGDAQEPPDLILSDLQVEDVVNVNDRLVFEARLKVQGKGLPDTVPVVLYEMKDGKLVELARDERVRLDPTGRPVKVRLVHAPTEPGRKVYVIEVPFQEGEAERANNRLERTVVVEKAKKVRVLMVEGYPRYEYRFLKTLLEREKESSRNKGKGSGEAEAQAARMVDLSVLLLSASKDYGRQERVNVLTDFPTKKDLLDNYDVVILGDVDPRKLPGGENSLDALAAFVRERGGGLLMIAGEQAPYSAYKDSVLADVLPVLWDVPAPAEGPSTLDNPITEGYRPRLTPVGQNHPVFRFVGDEAENAAVWSQLKPMFWYATGYRRKPSAEVLAVHPDRAAEPPPGVAGPTGENHPLALQQFVGRGRVLFFGFDETWRWRFRENEVRFNQFWLQVVRSLARNRLGSVELRLDRQTPYRRDEPIRITVRFPDDAPPPGPDSPVRVTVRRSPLKDPARPNVEPDEVETQTLQLAPVEGTRATFETLLTRTPEGEYDFRLSSPPVPEPAPQVQNRVLPPPGELDRIQLNQEDMERAARESRGAYYPLDRADQLPDELKDGPRVALDQPCPPWSLWNHPAAFALVLSLLVSEWVLRKRQRLL